ncbi:hypothetical protein [Bradyrhizobium stylosanthis]|uniref:Uncharacterized protein n=1 Tax=Bradyrhizobium stylosanthis TaxID=1803665 RepID=A0A560CXJ9_9BRAD|nr:hypothetical protein [Bradyrhizobium stylosanthis]TWA89588.1 hypothetical protein FBZ96_11956 [Bradyrhizobium stylosanthis]
MGIPTPYQFARFTADGQSSAISWPGGRGVFAAFGTFGSGTIKLQASYDDGTTWIDVDRSGDTYVTFTANGAGGFELPKCQLRVSLSGSTSPSINSGVEHANQ